MHKDSSDRKFENLGLREVEGYIQKEQIGAPKSRHDRPVKIFTIIGIL